MADLTATEKYPDSWRLDHPDFSDVHKTTFSKGVVKDFQKIQDDPLQVAPMVKVEVEGQESDFIPIFFHPKKLYWDDPDYKATDFNQAKNYFEKAWMSFRGDDEVVVMLREGKPYAVMGFADGVPRLGEALFQIEFPSMLDNFGFIPGPPYVAQIKTQSIPNSGPTLFPGGIGDLYAPDQSGFWSPFWWNLNEKGLDGNELKLTRDCPVKLVSSKSTASDAWYFINAWICTHGGPSPPPQDWLDLWWIQHQEVTTQEYAVVIPVGPFLYKIKFQLKTTKNWDTLWSYLNSGDRHVISPWQDETFPPHIYDTVHKVRDYINLAGFQPGPPPGTGIEIPWSDMTLDWAKSQIPDFNPAFDGVVKNWYFSADPDGNTIPTPSDAFPGQAPFPGPHGQEQGDASYELNPTADLSPTFVPFTVGAALYKKSLEDDPESGDFIYQSDFSIMMYLNLVNLGVPDPKTMKFLARPHTSEELGVGR